MKNNKKEIMHENNKKNNNRSFSINFYNYIYCSTYAIEGKKTSTYNSIKEIKIESELPENDKFEEIPEILSEIESKNYREEELTLEEKEVLNNNIESAIQATHGIDNTAENIEAVKVLLRDDISIDRDGEYLNLYSNRSRTSKKKPTIRIKVKTAAAVFNAIIFLIAAGATGGTGVAAMRAMIKKWGQQQQEII